MMDEAKEGAVVSTSDISAAMVAEAQNKVSLGVYIFAHYSPSTEAATDPVSETLGSSVYLQQRDLLQKFFEENRFSTNSSVRDLQMNFNFNFQNSASTSNFRNPLKEKLYRGVRQRHWGKRRWMNERRRRKKKRKRVNAYVSCHVNKGGTLCRPRKHKVACQFRVTCKLGGRVFLLASETLRVKF